MQKNFVKAFRQRLARAGFTDISILDTFDGCYHVRCFSPIGVYVSRSMTPEEMINTPHLVWFD